jgi:hypothetical protein
MVALAAGNAGTGGGVGGGVGAGGGGAGGGGGGRGRRQRYGYGGSHRAAAERILDPDHIEVILQIGIARVGPTHLQLRTQRQLAGAVAALPHFHHQADFSLDAQAAIEAGVRTTIEFVVSAHGAQSQTHIGRDHAGAIGDCQHVERQRVQVQVPGGQGCHRVRADRPIAAKLDIEQRTQLPAERRAVGHRILVSVATVVGTGATQKGRYVPFIAIRRGGEGRRGQDA